MNFAQIVSGLQAQRKKLQNALTQMDSAITALRGLNSRGGVRANNVVTMKPRRRMSTAARRRIAAAQRARWAKWKAKHRKKAA